MKPAFAGKLAFAGSGDTSRLTICIPAYRAGAFIERAVESVFGQTYRNWQLIISNDEGHDSADLDYFARYDNVEVRHWPERRGWVANTNWLIEAVRTPFFAILPHDDELHPDYYAVLIDMLRNDPGAQCAYSAIRPAGRPRQTTIASQEIVGTATERIHKVLTTPYSGVSYRAVNRRGGEAGRLTIPGNRFDNMFADSTWIMRQAIAGDMLYHDEPLYIKHYHPENTHTKWLKAGKKKVPDAWLCYCLQIAWLASLEAGTEMEKETIYQLAGERVFSSDPDIRPVNIQKICAAFWNDADRERQLARFKTVLRRAHMLRSSRKRRLPLRLLASKAFGTALR